MLRRRKLSVIGPQYVRRPLKPDFLARMADLPGAIDRDRNDIAMKLRAVSRFPTLPHIGRRPRRDGIAGDRRPCSAEQALPGGREGHDVETRPAALPSSRRGSRW